MDRAAAEKVFAFIADLKGDLRERQITERWWLIWIVSAFQILPTNLLTQWLIWRGEARTFWYVAVWGGQLVALLLTILAIHRGGGGQRSHRETFIWWIWATFLAAASLWAVLNQVLGLPLFFTAPVIPLLAAVAWSMMGMAVHRAFLLGAGLFAATTVAMSLLPTWQFVVYGGCWFVTLLTLGVYFRPRPHEGTAL